MFEALGSLTYRFRYLLVVAWVAAAIASVALAPSLAGQGSTDQSTFLPTGTASLLAKQATEAAFPGSTGATSATLTFSRPTGLTDTDRDYIAAVASWVQSTDAPEQLRSAVTGTESAESRPELASMLRSEDGQLELLVVNLDVATAGDEGQALVADLRQHLAATTPEGLTTHVTGSAGISSDYLDAIKRGTDSTTVVTVVLVLAILLLIYRAPLAALIPLVTIGAAFAVARGVLGVLASLGWGVSSLIDTFLVVLVFGVGTDYAIFLISRYREEVAHGDWHVAARTTVKRIGAVISASAATVIVGLGAMAFGEFKMIQTTGPALAVGIFVTLIAGLTLAPALLSIFGHYLFWPRHEQAAPDGETGFFARLASAVSKRPGIVTAALLIGLGIPALFVPQMKTNFDLLAELPKDSDARAGYEEVAAHLGEGKLVQSTGIIDVAAGTDLRSPASLARVQALLGQVASTPGVATVTSLVTPDGDGVVPDAFKPSAQLRSIADQLGDQTATGSTSSATGSSADLLDPKVSDGLASALAYVEAIRTAYPDLAQRAEVTATVKAIDDAQALVERVREQSVLSTQLRSMADAVTSPTASAGGGTSPGILVDYLDELAGAYPEVKTLDAFKEAHAAAGSLERTQTIDAALTLSSGLQSLAAHFDARPDATFSPTALSNTEQAKALKAEATRIFDALPTSFDAMAGLFDGRTDDIFVPTGLAGTDGQKVDDAVSAFVSGDGTAMRFYVTLAADPYSTEAFDTIRRIQPELADGAHSIGSSATAYLGGPTAEFADVQDVLQRDFTRVGVITVIGILLVLMLLLRAMVAPLYLVGTVLLSFASALGLSAWFFQDVLGHAGVSFYLPILVFVLLVALGSDYNIFLMSRVREESEHRPIHDGIRIASGHTGAVITSAGLILAGTFGSMATAPLIVLFQVGVAVALGVLIDTFLVRSILVPAITYIVGDRAWWPSGSGIRASLGRLIPVPVAVDPMPELAMAYDVTAHNVPGPDADGADGAMAGGASVSIGPRSRRRLAVALALVLLVPAILAGLLTWAVHDPGTSLGSLPAAVVDQDTGATATAADGTTSDIHLGRALSTALTAGTASATFDWTATDAADASTGLADGRYVAVLTIPADFSTKVAAIQADRTGKAPQATLELATTDGTSGGLGDVARDVTAAVAATASRSVTDSYVGDILLSIAGTRDATAGAATKARDLADGTSGLSSDAAGTGAVADRLVVGLEQLASGAATATDGTKKLADGTQALASGTDGLASGASKVDGAAKAAASGADQLTSGASQLADGMAQLNSQVKDLPGQVDTLATGAAGVASGAAGVAQGAADLAAGLTTMAGQTTGLGAQAQALDSGAQGLASGAAKVSSGAAQTAAGAAKLSSGAASLSAAVDQYTAGVSGISAQCVATLGAADPLCAQLAGLAATNGELTGGAADTASGAKDLAAGTADVADGAKQTSDGATALAAGTASLAAQAPALEQGIADSATGATTLSTGAAGVASGAAQVSQGLATLSAAMPSLAGGVADLSTGAAGVASGSQQLSGGLGQLASGTSALASGATRTAAGADALASGMSSAASGAGQLVGATSQAADAARLLQAEAAALARSGGSLSGDAGSLADQLGSSADAMPAWSQTVRSSIAELAAAPVAISASSTGGGAPLGGGLPPVFLAIALWVGGLAIFLVLPARWWRGGRGWRAGAAIVGAWVLIGLVQAVLAVVLLRVGLGIDVARMPALIGVGVLAGVTFAAIVQALVALWGRRGWLVALLLLGLQVAAAGIPYAVDSLPAPLEAIRPLLPMTWAIDAMRTAVAGAGSSMLLAGGILAGWLAVALLVTLAIAAGGGRLIGGRGAGIDASARGAEA